MNANVDHFFPDDQDYLHVVLHTFQQLPDHQTFLKTAHSGSVFWVNENPVLAAVLAAMTVLPLILLLRFIYKRRQRKAKRPPPLSRHPQVQSSESLRDMQVWETTRDRASTFDFFGMHHKDRNRSQSMGSLIGPPNAPIKSYGRKDSLMADLDGLELTLKGEEALALCGTGAYYQDGGYLYDEFGIVNLSFQVEYLGVRQSQLKYSTWTPPTSWKEASRRILPQDIMLKLQRDILLDVTKSTVSIKEPTSSGKWDFELPLEEFSTHVLPPVEGGVINLYVKGSSKEEWMEYTFETAQMSAQFQLDLLASQVFGKTLHHLFQVLTMVYEGSLAHKGQEFALHDDRKVVEEEKADDQKENHPPVAAASGVAWDDAMRSMSSIPSVRIALERLWLHYRDDRHGSGSNKKRRAATQEDAPTESQVSLSDEYVKKRLLLGPVDFFRLFVPVLPETAVPQNESGKARMEQLLRWRKRTARAAVLVKAYTLSHRVVNQGWKFPFPIPPTIRPLTKRLAYDGNEDNNRRDVSATNEYYEATVSRDIMCPVRPYDYFSENGDEWGLFFSRRKSVLSPCQAYSLVGMHVFKLPDNKAGHPLNPLRDPVASIPSLRELVSSHPEVDFIIVAHYPESRPVVFVTCHCRSLAKGLDPAFDNVMGRFIDGTEETRDRKLHLMLQLGPYQHGLSFFGWLILRILSILLGLTRKGRECSVGLLESSKERSPFPAIRLMNYSQLRHFGGALQTDPSLPKNYVSMNVTFHNKHMPNILSRILFHRLDKGAVEKNIMDFTFVLEGEQEDELPERALCTQRIVHVETQKVALPVSFSSARLDETKDETAQASRDRDSINSAAQILQDFVSAIGSPFRGQHHRHRIASEDSSSEESYSGGLNHTLNYVESDDPFEMAANEITDLLAGAIVPVRKDQLQLAKDSKKLSSQMNTLQHEASVPVPVLKLLTRSDMKRFFKAANGDLKTAAVRLVKTTAWRGQTFPIDKRKCRIELQNGQFFQHGHDRQGNPIFYFRNSCLGPWRENEDAIIYAVLHRLDECLQEFSKYDPDVKCTLIILMGRPYGERKKKQGKIIEIVQESDRDEVDEEDHDDEALGDVSQDQLNFVSNPRIARGETWWPHTNKPMIHRLLKLLEQHYPERLARAFLVKGHGSNSYYATKIRGRVIATALLYPETRAKVKFIMKLAELKTHIEASELLTIVGGTATIHPSVFECL